MAEADEFSKAFIKGIVTRNDLRQVREWKDLVVKMRDRHTGSELYDLFNGEVKRIVEFLMQERFKDFD